MDTGSQAGNTVQACDHTALQHYTTLHVYTTLLHCILHSVLHFTTLLYCILHSVFCILSRGAATCLTDGWNFPTFHIWNCGRPCGSIIGSMIVTGRLWPHATDNNSTIHNFLCPILASHLFLKSVSSFFYLSLQSYFQVFLSLLKLSNIIFSVRFYAKNYYST